MMTQPPDKTTALRDDPALIEQARRDPEAFAALYRRYLTPVYRYLYSRLGSIHDAEDITSQVFIETLEGLSTNHYRAGGCFSAWLFTIARRRLVDFYRQRPTAPLDEIPSAEPSLLVALEKSDDLKHLARLLAQLDEEKQELLRLRFSAGLSFAEIAKLENRPHKKPHKDRGLTRRGLTRSEAAVKMALYRALDWLHEHWEAENG
jgi:RNA polymerase sigma-70 factor (ECF subfamily)